MAVRQINRTALYTNDGPQHAEGPIDRAKDEVQTLKTLFRQLGDDATTLVQEEIALAKLEMRKEGRAIAADAVKVAIALSLAWMGGLALTAFLIIAIGGLLDSYWAGALIVGAVFLLIGGVMAKGAVNDLKTRSLKPEDTVATLREDKRWAKQEAQDFKREMSTHQQ